MWVAVAQIVNVLGIWFTIYLLKSYTSWDDYGMKWMVLMILFWPITLIIFIISSIRAVFGLADKVEDWIDKNAFEIHECIQTKKKLSHQTNKSFNKLFDENKIKIFPNLNFVTVLGDKLIIKNKSIIHKK